jgi:hypothetical protein
VRIEVAVYLLCFATSVLCAGLLVRSYLRTRTSLLFWSALCFVLLSLNSFIVVLDMLVLRDIDLTPWRHAASLAAICVLLYGFVWRLER